jgi:hypothetical protein
MDRNSMVVALSGQICGTILLISLIAAWVTRRRKAIAPPAEGLGRVEARLAEMQHSLDAVAIEVERISEGQRFATKLLTERGAAAIPDANGIREPIHRGTPR